MGRGQGGYTEKQTTYKDSGGHKVTDQGAVFVAERYIDQGYEAVFRLQILQGEESPRFYHYLKRPWILCFPKAASYAEGLLMRPGGFLNMRGSAKPGTAGIQA